jgi:hypothetical protein
MLSMYIEAVMKKQYEALYASIWKGRDESLEKMSIAFSRLTQRYCE